jgi:hypothetical protein
MELANECHSAGRRDRHSEFIHAREGSRISHPINRHLAIHSSELFDLIGSLQVRADTFPKIAQILLQTELKISPSRNVGDDLLHVQATVQSSTEYCQKKGFSFLISRTAQLLDALVDPEDMLSMILQYISSFLMVLDLNSLLCRHQSTIQNKCALCDQISRQESSGMSTLDLNSLLCRHQSTIPELSKTVQCAKRLKL